LIANGFRTRLAAGDVTLWKHSPEGAREGARIFKSERAAVFASGAT